MSTGKPSSIIIFTLFLLAISAVATGDPLKTAKSEIAIKNITPKKYHIKANFSPKTQRNKGYFRVSNFDWSEGKSLSKSSHFGWHNENGFNIWKPKGTNPFTHIPLHQNQENSAITNPEEIHIDYQDLYPENPILPFLKLVFTKANTSDPTSKSVDEKKLFLLGVDETKVTVGLNKSKIPKLINTDNSINVASSTWKEKDNIYLAKRTLGLESDSIWRYAKDRHYTVFQRRFKKILKSSEVIELVFDKNISQDILKEVVCNIRISYSGSRQLHVIPHLYMKPILFNFEGNSILRLDLSYLNKDAYYLGKVPFLAEVIIFYPEREESVISQRPVQTVLFHKQEGFESTEYLSPASWKKMNTSYLIKRELGLSINPTWRFNQDSANAVFKRRLHKDIGLTTTMDIIFDGKSITDGNQVNCSISLGFHEHPRPSETISCEDLIHKTLQVGNKYILRVELKDLADQRYAKGKKRVFIEELTIYLPGNVTDYINGNVLENVRFYNFSPYFKKNIITDFLDPNSTEKEMASATTLKGFSRVKFFSRDSKRIVFDLRKILSTIDQNFRLENVDLYARPLTPKETSGLHLKKANALIPFGSKISALLSPGKNLHKRWGGPFTKSEKEKGKIQLIQINEHFPYENFHKNIPYISGDETRHGVSVNSIDEVLHRLSKGENGTDIALMFFKKNSSAYFILSSIGPFENDRIITLDWEIEGSIQVKPVNSLKIWTNNRNKIEYLLPRGTIPKFAIKVFKNVNFNSASGNRSSILLKHAKVHGEKTLRIGLQSKDLISPKYESSQIFLKGIQVKARRVPLQINPTSTDKVTFRDNVKSSTQRNVLLRNLEERSFWNQIKMLSNSSTNTSWHYYSEEDFSFDNVDLVLDTSLGPSPLKNIDCIIKFGTSNFFKPQKTSDCLDFPFMVISSQDIKFSFSKSTADTSSQLNFLKTGNTKLRTPGFFSKWNVINDGMILVGKGNLLEIDWKIRANLIEESRFYLGIPEGAESVLSAEIIPFSEGRPLQPIPALLNYPVKLDLPTKSIDRLKIQMKFSDEKPFRLVLDEMVLFKPISMDLSKAVDLPTLLYTNPPLTPVEFRGNLPMEVLIKKKQLKATVLTKRGTSGTFNWSTKVNQKPSNIQWIKIKHLLSPSIHASNPCWLELTFLGQNQKTHQTICTNKPDGSVLVPVSDRFTDDSIESIFWSAHVDNQKNLLPLLVDFNLTISMVKNIDIIREDIGNTPILEIMENKISPAFSLSSEKVTSRDNWLDLGIHSIDQSTFNMQGFRFPDHPYLRINSILVENFLLHKIDGPNSILETNGTITSKGELPWVNIIRKLLFILGAIIVFRWLWIKGWCHDGWEAMKANSGLVKSYATRIFSLAGKLISMVYAHTFFINRLVGLAGGVIIMLTDLQFGEPNFITLALILTGVLWHEVRKKISYSEFSQTGFHAICFGDQHKVPALFYCLTLSVIAWVVWQVTHLNGRLPSIDFIGPILSLIYFYLPWSSQLFKALPRHSEQPCLFWLTLAGGVYLVGIIGLLGGITFRSFLNILSFGSLAMVPAWGYFIKDIQPKLENRWPNLAKKVYAGKDSQYIVGFLIIIVCTALCRILNLEQLAEQFAILGFYILIIGIVLKFKKTLTPSTISLK